MGNKAMEDRDFDYVIGKMPRYDKDGHDVTNDKMGPGGRRKANGRQSVQVYDLEKYNEVESREEIEARLKLYAEADERNRARQRDQIIDGIDIFFEILYKVSEFLESHPGLTIKMMNGAMTIRKRAVEGFRVFKRSTTNLKMKFISKKDANGKQTENIICGLIQEEKDGVGEQRLVVEGNGTVAMSENSSQFQSIVLSREEAIREVFNALNHYIEFKRSLNKLSSANIIDIKRLGFEKVIEEVEKLMQQYPDLLNKSNQCEMIEILTLNFDEIERKRIETVLGIKYIGANCANQITI